MVASWRVKFKKKKKKMYMFSNRNCCMLSLLSLLSFGGNLIISDMGVVAPTILKMI